MVHFIGSHKPWFASRPSFGRTRPTGAPSRNYDDLLLRWFEVYEAHYDTGSHTSLSGQSTAGRKTPFVVPRLTSTWDSAARSKVTYTPIQPEDLKLMFANPAHAAEVAGEGVYISLPLDGRVDLLRPLTPSPMSSPHGNASPSGPVGIAQNGGRSSPQMSTWNPALSSPPKSHTQQDYQMREPMTHVYDNAWDHSSSSTNQLFVAPSKYPPIPQRLVQEGHYANLGSSNPDIHKVRPVFPWEQGQAERGSRRDRPQRVFPDDHYSARQSYGNSSMDDSDEDYHPSSRHARPGNARGQPSFHGNPGMPDHLTYRNAWDNDAGIRSWADRSKVNSGRGGRKGFSNQTSESSVQSSPMPISLPALARRDQNLNGALQNDSQDTYDDFGAHEAGMDREASSRDGDDEDDSDSADLSPGLGYTPDGASPMEHTAEALEKVQISGRRKRFISISFSLSYTDEPCFVLSPRRLDSY